MTCSLRQPHRILHVAAVQPACCKLPSSLQQRKDNGCASRNQWRRAVDEVQLVDIRFWTTHSMLQAAAQSALPVAKMLPWGPRLL